MPKVRLAQTRQKSNLLIVNAAQLINNAAILTGENIENVCNFIIKNKEKFSEIAMQKEKVKEEENNLRYMIDNLF